MLASIVFLFLFAYLPGKLLVSFTRLSDWPDLKLAIGLAVLPLVLFFGRWFLPVTWLLAIYLALVLFFIKTRRLKFKPIKLKIPLPILIILCIGIIAQSLPYLQTIFYNPDQLITAIASNHDQTWHLSLINYLTQSFPPALPGFSGLTLKNYHYFYDLILAAQTSLFRSDPALLLQLVYPLLFSALFGLASYRVLTLITSKRLFHVLGILLVFFSNNLSYLLSPFGLKLFDSNSLLIDQPLFFIFNHQTVFSLALVLYLFLLVHHQLKKPSLFQAVLIGLCLASLSYLKVYAFVIAFVSLGFVSLKNFKSTFPSIAIAGLTTLVILLPTFQPGQSWLSLQPFWLSSYAFVHQVIAPYLPQLYARSHQFWFPFLSLFLLLTLNYHFRLFGLVYCFLKKKTYLLNLIFISTLVSLIALFLGYQTQSPHNIIQFAPYATTGLALLTLAVSSQLKPKLGLTLISLILLLGLPTSFKTITAFAQSQPELPPLRQEYLELVKSLSSLPTGLTLSLIDRDYHLIPDPDRDLNFIGNNLINSIGRQPVFFADVKQLQVLGVDYQARLNQINSFKHNLCQDKSLLIDQDIRYLLVADDLWHCLGDPNLDFTLVNQTDHFALYSLSRKDI